HGIETSRMQPCDGEAFVLSTEGALPATRVLFLGTPHLRKLGYDRLREFGAEALRILKHEGNVRHIAATIHGPGYGLDESEATLALVSGLLMGVRLGACPPELERISLVERKESRVELIRSTLADALAKAPHVHQEGTIFTVGHRTGVAQEHAEGDPPSPGEEGPQAPDLIASPIFGQGSDIKPHAFVAMPFTQSFEDVYFYGIRPPIKDAGMLSERIDQEVFSGDIFGRIKERIETADLVVAELTGANPNVYLELGYAWGKGRPTILLSRSVEDLRFDVQGQRVLLYNSIRQLEARLRQELRTLVARGILKDHMPNQAR
ncbi:MAG: hypothetical protein AAFS10_25735, partial [Myxococcota bacterium]